PPLHLPPFSVHDALPTLLYYTRRMEFTFPTEPVPTAIGLAVVGLLVAVAVTLGRTIGRRGVPVVLLFMVLGMVAGSEGIGGIALDRKSTRLNSSHVKISY